MMHGITINIASGSYRPNVNGLHHRTVRARMDAAHESFEKARAHIENSSMTVYNYLASLVTAYDKAKRHHDEQVADCLKVFDDCLGPAATSVVRLELLNCRFRRPMSSFACTTLPA
jgi:hypothetical protein